MHDNFFIHGIDSLHSIFLLFPMLITIETWQKWMQKHKDSAEKVEINRKWAISFLQGVLTALAMMLISLLKIPLDSLFFLSCLLITSLFTIIYVIWLCATNK